VFLHGGPGGGIDPIYRRYFDPKKWRIVLFDQRGCGKSKPFAELRENTTWDLVATSRSCASTSASTAGSSSAAAGAARSRSPTRRRTRSVCQGLVLRGIFLLRRSELLWFYQEGASHLFPDAWEGYLAPIPPRERGDLMKAYYKRLTSKDKKVRTARGEGLVDLGGHDEQALHRPRCEALRRRPFADAFARIEAHYFVNRGFFEARRPAAARREEAPQLPGVIVQGRYDVVCPMRSAWDLHRAWPEAKLVGS
jgi:proline iminopeptidase